MVGLLSDYMPYQQHDSFDTFLNILDHLFRINHQLKNSFEINFTYKCTCNEMLMKF